MFKRKKKKTGVQTPEFRRPTPPPPPPTSGSNAVKPNISYGYQPIYTLTQNPPDTFSSLLKSAPVCVLPNDISTVDYICTYSTPCGWCVKWDKKCDEKIGKRHNGLNGKKGAIGVCPNCGESTSITWSQDTDVSTCSCGWNNEKPQRGLRANTSVYDDAMDPALKDIISGKGLSRLDTTFDPNKPLPSGIRKDVIQ